MNIIEIQRFTKDWINANVWDGEDRSGCPNDWATFCPDDLQELIDDLVDDLLERLQ